jgi:hypothetical protein
MSLKQYIKNSEAFTENILTEIEKLPFGSLPKAELELLILDSIIRSIEPEDPYGHIEKHFNELKTTLRLSQTQLKNKILSAQLRYDKITDSDVEKFILQALGNNNYMIENNFIVIPIFNPLLNDQAKSYFEIKRIITDTSFNKSLLKINLNGFISFIEQLSFINHLQKNSIFEYLDRACAEGIIISKDKDASRIFEVISDTTSIGANLITIIQSIINLIQ